MYSPKISASIVPQLYKLAKQQKQPMTKLVNTILLQHLTEHVADGATAAPAPLQEIKSKAS